MAIRKIKPTTPGQRGMTVSAFEEITCTKPERSLLEDLKSTGGRNNAGRITVRHRGGGAKRKYRVIDFKRNKDGIPAKVATIEYDPNRSANIALLHYADGEKRYIIAPLGLQVGDSLLSGEGADIKVGNALQIKNIPVGATASSSSPARARSWSGPPATLPSSWPRKASTPRFVSPAAKCAGSPWTPRPPSARWAMWTMPTSCWAKPAAPGIWASVPPCAVPS